MRELIIKTSAVVLAGVCLCCNGHITGPAAAALRARKNQSAAVSGITAAAAGAAASGVEGADGGITKNSRSSRQAKSKKPRAQTKKNEKTPAEKPAKGKKKKAGQKDTALADGKQSTLLGVPAVKTASSAQPKPVGANIEWKVKWIPDKNLINYAGIKVRLPGEFTVRAQGFDRRPGMPWEETNEARQDFGLGLYQKTFDARLLYGGINRWGLMNRTKNLWAHNLPFFEAHKSSGADLSSALDTEPDRTLFAQLSLPASAPVNVYAASYVHDGQPADWTAGVRYAFTPKVSLAAEGFYKNQKLEERPATTWFQDKPRLPERDFEFYAGSLVFSNPWVSFAGDTALSRTFAQGDGLYANGVFRAGYRPWNFSLAAESAGSRFSGSDGAVSGARFRAGSQFEWKGKRSMAFKALTTLTASALGEPFDRSKTSFYYHFPVLGRGSLNITSLSFAFERDGVRPDSIKDGFEAAAVFRAGPFRPAVKYAWDGVTFAEPESLIMPYPNPADMHEFAASKLTLDLGFAYSFLYLKASAICEDSEKKGPVWKSAYTASIKHKWGTVSARIDGKPGGSFSYSFTAKTVFSF
ncbi:MAG: hypothetical protein LBG74_03715 [Spirochaetaceae bacterium]|jgi:hypothetical protein|nr:hypothetical protein [Spirochaetaceae bacterium]